MSKDLEMPCRKIIRIGRSHGNDFVVDSGAVSADHALLLLSHDGQHLLVDRNSMNGTRVSGGDGGSKIKQKIVTEVEEIFFGDVSRTVGEIVRACE